MNGRWPLDLLLPKKYILRINNMTKHRGLLKVKFHGDQIHSSLPTNRHSRLLFQRPSGTRRMQPTISKYAISHLLTKS